MQEEVGGERERERERVRVRVCVSLRHTLPPSLSLFVCLCLCLPPPLSLSSLLRAASLTALAFLAETRNDNKPFALHLSACITGVTAS